MRAGADGAAPAISHADYDHPDTRTEVPLPRSKGFAKVIAADRRLRGRRRGVVRMDEHARAGRWTRPTAAPAAQPAAPPTAPAIERCRRHPALRRPRRRTTDLADRGARPRRRSPAPPRRPPRRRPQRPPRRPTPRPPRRRRHAAARRCAGARRCAETGAQATPCPPRARRRRPPRGHRPGDRRPSAAPPARPPTTPRRAASKPSRSRRQPADARGSGRHSGALAVARPASKPVIRSDFAALVWYP